MISVLLYLELRTLFYDFTENVTDQRICPSAIRAISSNQSGLASVTIQSHALLLPPGKYPLSLGGSNCSQVVITVAGGYCVQNNLIELLNKIVIDKQDVV